MTEYTPWVDPKNLMIEDSGICELSINSVDARFWNMNAYDKYVKCDDQNCSNASLTEWRSGTYTSTSDDTNNWEIPYMDNDYENPFCVPLDATDPLYGLYMCKQIKCTY